MNLQEYINQTEPKQMPIVGLKRNEVVIYNVNKKYLVQVPELNKKYGIDAVYIVKENNLSLWTINEHGTKKDRSCFYLNFKLI